MKIQDFDHKLEKYAELIVKVGLNLQPGQRLFIVAFSLDVAPLVRQVVKSAYKNGSRLVSVLWLDEHLDKIRHQNAPRDSFAYARVSAAQVDTLLRRVWRGYRGFRRLERPQKQPLVGLEEAGRDQSQILSGREELHLEREGTGAARRRHQNVYTDRYGVLHG